MLYLLIQIDDELYGVEARPVVEILPIIRWRRLPQAPAGILGVINFHGEAVPVLDLNQILTGQPSRRHVSTKIIVFDYQKDFENTFHLAVVVERILETITIPEDGFVESGVATPGAPYAGPIAMTPRGVVQRLDLDRVLAAENRDQLFSSVREHEVEVR